MYRRFGLLLVVVCLAGVLPLAAGPILSGVWYEFGFEQAGDDATGCTPADPGGIICTPSSGTPTVFADVPAWTFTSLGPAIFTVVDAFLSGDSFSVYNFGVLVGSTPAVAVGINCGSDPVTCLATPGMSTASFLLPAGSHSITIGTDVSPFDSGAAYFRWQDRGHSEVPEPATWLLMGSGLFAAGLMRRRLRA